MISVFNFIQEVAIREKLWIWLSLTISDTWLRMLRQVLVMGMILKFLSHLCLSLCRINNMRKRLKLWLDLASWMKHFLLLNSIMFSWRKIKLLSWFLHQPITLIIRKRELISCLGWLNWLRSRVSSNWEQRFTLWPMRRWKVSSVCLSQLMLKLLYLLLLMLVILKFMF